MMGILAVKSGVTGVSSVQFFFFLLTSCNCPFIQKFMYARISFATTAVENTSQSCEQQ